MFCNINLCYALLSKIMKCSRFPYTEKACIIGTTQVLCRVCTIQFSSSLFLIKYATNSFKSGQTDCVVSVQQLQRKELSEQINKCQTHGLIWISREYTTHCEHKMGRHNCRRNLFYSYSISENFSKHILQRAIKCKYFVALTYIDLFILDSLSVGP